MATITIKNRLKGFGIAALCALFLCAFTFSNSTALIYAANSQTSTDNESFVVNAWILMESSDSAGNSAANLLLEYDFPEWYTEDIWDVDFVWGDYAVNPVEYVSPDNPRGGSVGVANDVRYELRVNLPDGKIIAIDLWELKEQAAAANRFLPDYYNGGNHEGNQASSSGYTAYLYEGSGRTRFSPANSSQMGDCLWREAVYQSPNNGRGYWGDYESADDEAITRMEMSGTWGEEKCKPIASVYDSRSG